MLYTKVNSHVTREFGPSHLTKIEEHVCVAARECQLRREQYRISIFFNPSGNMKQSFGRRFPVLYHPILLYFILGMAIVANSVHFARICSYYASILLFAFAFLFF